MNQKSIPSRLLTSAEILSSAWEFLGKDYHIEASGERPQVRVSYILTAWPDYSDGGIYITGIEITAPSVSVCGLTSEPKSSEFEQVLRSMGYEVETINSTLMRAANLS